uniref:Uncharacterized protein n=1 Tax=Anguilla anguilla TaxID=7936 RepID=A0A0E9SU90_ANGAN
MLILFNISIILQCIKTEFASHSNKAIIITMKGLVPMTVFTADKIVIPDRYM